MTMKKILLTTVLTTGMAMSALAQYDGAGYYRVRNVGLLNLASRDCYTYVTDNKFEVITQAGTGQTFEPLQLWEGLDEAIASPASVIYASGTADNIKLSGQETNVTDFTGGRKLVLSTIGTVHRLSTTAAGATVYLYTTTNIYGKHYVGTTVSASNVAYSYWHVLPITTDGDNYVGVKPTMSAGGKYYAPYYASYPFKLHSAGMKAYIVSNYDNQHFELSEVTQEVIPAATPVLIECSTENVSDNRLELLTGSYAALAGNKLSGVYFCNDFISPSYSPGARTQFDESAMRVWNVENDQLVLSTSTELLHKSYYSSESAYRYLNANQSYLTVPATAASTMTIGTVGIADVSSDVADAIVVSYTTADGKEYREPQPGLNIVRYSDGTVRKYVK